MKNKKNIIISVIALLIAVGGYQVYITQQATEERRAATEKQKQIMIEHWQSEGLSEEEIQEKLQTEFTNQNSDDRPWYSEIMRTVRHSTGTGPGTNQNN